MFNLWIVPLLHSVNDVSYLRSITALIHKCHAMSTPLRAHRSESDFSRSRHSTAGARCGMCELTSAAERRPVGDLPRFGFFRLSRGVPRRLSSESQTEMQLAIVKPSNVCYGRGKADYFGARTRVLYNLQHKDHVNNLVNNNIWRPYIVASSMYTNWCLLKGRSTWR